MALDRFGWVGRTLEPRQHRLFRHAEHTADARQINPDQEHREGHHDLLVRRAEIEKDCLAGLRKVRRTRVAAKEASLATLGEIRGDSTHVALLHASIMSALGMRARLAPIFGFPHRASLR